jgi:hypothetical protein
MGKRSRERRKGARSLLIIGALVGALGIAAPASALITFSLPPIAGALSPIVVSGDGIPNSTGDLTSATAANLAATTNVLGGLATAGSTLTQLLSGLKGAAAVAAPVVSATATSAAGTAITDLVARAQQTAADAAALDLSGDQGDLLGEVTDLQSQATSEIAGLIPLALTTGLQVAQNIVTPVCSLTAVPSSLVPGVGVDTTRLWTQSIPAIQVTDQTTNSLLRQTYANVYNQTLASVNNIPNVGPIASALLTLLKYNWTSTYYPPGSTTPVVQTTPALMNVPTPIDVDGDGSFDLCGTTSFALTGSGTSITGIKITQTITKMPLAKPVLPVEINGGLLNVINFGEDTTESTVPIIYTSSATLDSSSGGRLNVDNSYSVFRGMNLTIPPASLAALNLAAGDLPNIPPLLTPAPKPIVTQETCIVACSTIAIKDRFENVPNTTHVDSPLASAGVNVNYTAPSTSDSYTHTFALTTAATLSTSAGRDYTSTSSPLLATPSAPTSFQSCLSVSDGSCSPNKGTGDKSSLSYNTNSPTYAESNVAIGGAAVNSCTGVAALGYTAHVNMTGSSFNTSVTPPGTGAGSGRIAIDTGGQAADGCTAAGSVLGLTGTPSITMPLGFLAKNRVSTYHYTSTFGLLTGTPIDTKTGTITCPTGTTAGYTSLSPIGSFNLQPVICSLPPINTAAPTISGLNGAGVPVVDATLTVNNGTWSPAAPNLPNYTYQWYRCDGLGANCAPIAGATTNTYTLQYGSYPAQPTDFGHTFKATVTGTNLDGTATATTATTPAAILPPPPTNATPPVLGASRQVGTALTTTNGTWNNGAVTYSYTWQQCDPAGDVASCANISGAPNAPSYTIAAADKGMTLRVGVAATNHGGTSAITYSGTAFIPPAPKNTAAPGIKNGPANAVGASVATGDNLSASTGTWSYTTSPFTYQWQRCDASGLNCADIDGATAATYQVQHPSDDGNTLRVAVIGHGLNGDTTAYSGTTGVVLFNNLSAKPVTQIPDGTVNATAAGAGTTTYVGGSFDTVGVPTGGSGLVSDSGAGHSVSLASATAGAANGGVMATVPDGSGGYFLGGSFTQVKGVQCPGLAHLLSDGTVDQNYCYANLSGTVKALTRFTGIAPAGSSKVLVVGGDFTIGSHKNLMFIDPAAPASPVFDSTGDPNGPVNTAAVNVSTQSSANPAVVYIGGRFNQAGGTAAGMLAAETLTWTSGQLTGVARNNWAAAVCVGTPASSTCADPTSVVNTVASLSSGFVAVGGHFSTSYKLVTSGAPAAGTTRNNALLVGDNGTSPSLLGWNPNIGGPVGTTPTVYAIAVGPANGINNIPVYIGGDFGSINGAANTQNLGEFGSTVLGTSAGTGTNNNSGPMTSWTPRTNGPVYSLAWAGTNAGATLIVGGGFTSITSGPTASATTLVRHRLAKIVLGASTGAVIPTVDATWDPNAGRTVRTVSRDTTLGTVTVGGDFLVLGGTTRNNLAEFDPNTGMTVWNPSVDGPVNALAYSAGTVYAGGSFANAGGSARANLAALSSSSGSASGWNPGTNGAVNAIALNGTNVYVGGSFGTAGGAVRSNLADIDAGSGTATGWNPGAGGAVRALAAPAGGPVYVGGAFATLGGAGRANLGAVDATGVVTAYSADTNGPVDTIVVDPSGIYVGGAFSTIGGASDTNVARTDATGAVDPSWSPNANGEVDAIFVVGSNVFVGGTFTAVGGATRSDLAAIDSGTGSALAFNPAPNGVVKALSRTSGGSIAVGGAFTVISGQAAPGLGFYGG